MALLRWLVGLRGERARRAFLSCDVSSIPAVQCFRPFWVIICVLQRLHHESRVVCPLLGVTGALVAAPWRGPSNGRLSQSTRGMVCLRGRWSERRNRIGALVVSVLGDGHRSPKFVWVTRQPATFTRESLATHVVANLRQSLRQGLAAFATLRRRCMRFYHIVHVGLQVRAIGGRLPPRRRPRQGRTTRRRLQQRPRPLATLLRRRASWRLSSPLIVGPRNFASTRYATIDPFYFKWNVAWISHFMICPVAKLRRHCRWH